MSEILNEQLSALVDGELPPAETALLLKRLGREPELAGRLLRYRLCGDVLRGERIQPRPDFAVRISARIAAEPAHVPAAAPASQRRRSAPAWLRPAAGLAVAAGVATLAVLVLQRSPGSASDPGPVVAAVRPVVTAVPAAANAPRAALPMLAGTAGAGLGGSGEPASYVTPAARPGLGVIPEATLANYVVAHSELSTPLAGRSVLIHLIADEPVADTPAR